MSNCASAFAHKTRKLLFLPEEKLMLPPQKIPWPPSDTMTSEEKAKLPEAERLRLPFATYYDPLYDKRFFDPTRHGVPLHLLGKTGKWYVPPNSFILNQKYQLTDQEKERIARELLGNLVIPSSTTALNKPSATSNSFVSSNTTNTITTTATTHPAPASTALQQSRQLPAFIRPAERTTTRRLREEQSDGEDSCPDCSDSDDDARTPLQKKQTVAEKARRSKLLRIERCLVNDIKIDYRDPYDQDTARAFRCISANSVYNYCSAITAIAQAGYPLTWEGYQRFISQNGEKFSAGTIKQYLTAFKHYARAAGLDGAKARTDAVNEAVAQEQGHSLNVRGTITQDLVAELIARPAVKAQPLLRDVFILLSATGVRSNQLTDLKEDACALVTTQPRTWRVTVRRNQKGNTKKNLTLLYEIHFTNPTWFEEVSRIVALARSKATDADPHPLLCPRWMEGRGAAARALLAQEAKALKWSPRLQWVVHSFRNGAACDAFMKYASQGDLRALEEVRRRTGHISLDMLRLYAIPESERESYRERLLGDSLLHATGVVANSLDGKYCPPPRTRSMVVYSQMKQVGDRLDFQQHVRDAPTQFVASRTGDAPSTNSRGRGRGRVAVARGRGGVLR